MLTEPRREPAVRTVVPRRKVGLNWRNILLFLAVFNSWAIDIDVRFTWSAHSVEVKIESGADAAEKKGGTQRGLSHPGSRSKSLRCRHGH